MTEVNNTGRSVTLESALDALEQLPITGHNEKELTTLTIEYLVAIPPAEREVFLDRAIELIRQNFGQEAIPPFYKALVLQFSDADWLHMDQIKRQARGERDTAERHAEMTPEEIAEEVRSDETHRRLRQGLP